MLQFSFKPPTDLDVWVRERLEFIIMGRAQHIKNHFNEMPAHLMFH